MIRKKEFATIALDQIDEIFIVYATFFVIFDEVHSSSRVQIALLKLDKIFTIIFSEFFDFTDIFSLELVAEISEYTRINNYAINFVDSK